MLRKDREKKKIEFKKLKKKLACLLDAFHCFRATR